MDGRPGAPGPAPNLPNDFDASELSRQFEQLLRTRRLNDLAERDRSSSRPSTPSHSTYDPAAYSRFDPTSPRPPQPIHASPRPSNLQPPSYSTYRSLPIVPSPPQDAASLKFRNLLLTLSVTPTKYENPGLLDEALTCIPTERIYAEADDEHNIMLAQAASMGENEKPEWGYQDCTSPLEAHRASNSIDAAIQPVWLTNAFPDILTSGHCLRLSEGDAANGQTVSVCFVELQAPE
ncbi:MAG: hypothetical protein Q9160_007848 [Pyrenula sp. 1 TL-2023]